MNKKTSLKRVYNYYNGTDDGVGRDSPGALLDMLAEVASQTLHSEKKWTELNEPIKSQNQSKNDQSVVGVKKKCQQEPLFNSSQLLSMPATQLVKQFSIFTSDELKRQYTYTCALVPGCGQRYTSFASEGRARMSIKAHLADHLDYLKRDEEAYSTFTAVAVKHRSPKSSPSNKKQRINNQQKKPTEALNKENNDTKAGKSTNYLRKILSNEMSFTEFEKQKNNPVKHEKTNEDSELELKKDFDDTEYQVLGDHSYYEHVKLVNEEEKITPDLNEMMVNQAMGENIMLMVVESDGVHMKELPYIAQDISVRADQDESETIYIPESVTWSEDSYAKNMDMSVSAKPKGKAKFIGTSKEEREMALALMERIKRKGNPGGGNLQCRICDPPRSFTAPTTLVSHYRSHAGIKPYECRICRAVFTRRHSLKYHMLIHQNQTRFTCADCGKKFRHPSHFREHRRRHTGEAPFGCEDCGQRFKTRNTYKRHLKTRHGKVLTTTGELLHLSEEDFQKVRTNPKRRTETNYSESMIDEDVTAPEAILNFDNQDCGNVVDDNLQVCDDLEGNYHQVISKVDEGNNSGNDDLWDIDNVGSNDDAIKNRYKNSEYYDEEESGVNKTDYIKTDIAVENCEFEEVNNAVNDLRYSEEQNRNCATVDGEVIGIDIQEDDDNRDEITGKIFKEEETTFDGDEDTRERIFYDENIGKDETNFIEYVQGIDVPESEEDNVMSYRDGMKVLKSVDDNNYDLDDERQEIGIGYFADNLNIDNEIEYEESDPLNEQLDTDRYEVVMDAVEDSNGESSRGPIADDPLKTEDIGNGDILVDGNREETQIFQSDNLSDGEYESVQKQNDNRYILDGTEVVERNGDDEEEEEGEKEESGGDETATEYQNHFFFQQREVTPSNDHRNSRANVAVEHIVPYSTTNYEIDTEHNNATANGGSHVYLKTNQSNNIIIKNKDLVSLLTQRIKLQQKNNPENIELQNSGKVVKLLNGQTTQSFGMIQNGKQGTVLLLASNNDLKNNFLQIDPTTGVAKGIKTLPVIAVQQK